MNKILVLFRQAGADIGKLRTQWAIGLAELMLADEKFAGVSHVSGPPALEVDVDPFIGSQDAWWHTVTSSQFAQLTCGLAKDSPKTDLSNKEVSQEPVIGKGGQPKTPSTASSFTRDADLVLKSQWDHMVHLAENDK